MAGDIKGFVQGRAIHAHMQLRTYEERLAATEPYTGESPIEALAVRVLQAREIGWQALHVLVSIPEYFDDRT